jgi:hypothetical protein
MPRKKRLVHSHIFDARALGVALEINDAIH